jgi:hypothetical protein
LRGRVAKRGEAEPKPGRGDQPANADAHLPYVAAGLILVSAVAPMSVKYRFPAANVTPQADVRLAVPGLRRRLRHAVRQRHPRG